MQGQPLIAVNTIAFGVLFRALTDGAMPVEAIAGACRCNSPLDKKVSR